MTNTGASKTAILMPGDLFQEKIEESNTKITKV
jgi:hypothetical protein